MEKLIQHIIKEVNPTDFISACLINGASIQEAYQLATAITLNNRGILKSAIEKILNKYPDKKQAALDIFRVFPPYIIEKIQEDTNKDINNYDLVKLTISQKVSSIYFQKNAIKVINYNSIPAFYDNKGRYSTYIKYAIKNSELLFAFVEKNKISPRDGTHYKLGATPQGDGTMAGAISKVVKNNAIAGFYKISPDITNSNGDIWHTLKFIKK